MSEVTVGKIEQLYKERPSPFDHWLIDVDEEITGGDMVKIIGKLKAQVKELQDKLSAQGKLVRARGKLLRHADDIIALLKKGLLGEWGQKEVEEAHELIKKYSEEDE